MADETTHAASGTVNLPGFGKIKKSYAIGGGAVLLILVIVWYRQRQSAQAANAAAANSATSATASDVSATNIDPATGYPYGSPEDQAALEAQSSFIGGEGFGGSGLGGFGGGGGSGTTTQGFATNGQWAQAAEQFMLNSDPSISADSVGAALGKYIAGSPVTADQQTLIQEAIAFEGNPPVNGTNGYPPSINVQSGGGGGGGGTGGTTKVPSVTGLTVDAADTALSKAGLTFNTQTAKDKPGYERKVTASSPKAGSNVAKGSKVGLTWHYVKG